ncbi:hypothetical protein D9M70_620000 [compost metagenome]
MPMVIMAKVVPDFLVVTKPSRMAKNIPARPPTSGMSTSGMVGPPLVAMFIAWMAMNEPRPV